MAPETLALLREGQAKKGDVLGTARIAGIMAAKRTHELIPLCHPLALSKVTVGFETSDDPTGVHVEAEVRVTGRTGVEMEALTAVSVACLTIYDMLKAADRGMAFSGVRLTQKSGGRSGDYRAEAERVAPMPLLSVAEALARVTADTEPLGTETVSLDEAHGRVLAADVAARLTQPPFNASAMDGYAARADDLTDLPRTLHVIGEAGAGHAFDGTVSSGEAARIFTGAPVPEGADTIVIQEDTTRDGDQVTVLEGAPAGTYVRPRGFDFAEGDVLLSAPRRLTARDTALAAAMNHATLTVRRRPKVAILATGDELVSPGESPAPDQIVSSNPFGLAPLVRAFGGVPERLGIARDTLGSLDQRMTEAEDADISGHDRWCIGGRA